MRHAINRASVLLVAAGSVLGIALTARGDIAGFNNLNGWTYNQGDIGVPSTVGADFLEITTGGRNQIRNVWFNTRQDITQFTATFTYRAPLIQNAAVRHGISFIIQNDPRGLGTLASNFNSTGFGFEGITRSAAVTIELDSGAPQSYSGFYRNGSLGGGSVLMSPLNAYTHNSIDVTIVYNGSVMSVSMTDGINAYPTHNYIVAPSFATAFASSTAFVGFGASTAAQGGCDQVISNFRFTSAVPGPSAAGLMVLCAGATNRRRRR